MGIDVVEFTDPGCSWAWGTEPKLRLLRWTYEDRLDWRTVMGGLVGDMENSIPGFDKARGAKTYTRYWAEVATHTGMPYPARLEWMYVSTEPAGKAVKAAALQRDDVADRVLRRFREATFVFGRPPDTTDTILESVGGTPGLDVARLADDLTADATEKTFGEDWEETRRPNEYVMTLEEDVPGAGRAKHTEGHWRFVFPTVIFRGPDGEATVPGWKPYEAYLAAMETASAGSTQGGRRRPTPQEAFARWPAMAPTEFAFVCGEEAELPDGIVSHDWGDGVYHMTAEEAAARGLR